MGPGAIVDALVRGVEKFGGEARPARDAEEILVEGEGDEKRAVGVRARGGETFMASKAVISNATLWDTVPMLPRDAMPREWIDEATSNAMCESFMHLHLGIDAADLPDDLEIHHIYVEDWNRGVTAEQNMVLISIPSVLDPSMAPAGKHVIHAQHARKRTSGHLGRLGQELRRVQGAQGGTLACVVASGGKGDPRRASTRRDHHGGHSGDATKILRRARGTYGGTGWISEDQDTIPITSASTPLAGFLVVGDSNFPGPGVPAVAAGGWSAARELIGPRQTAALLDKVCPPGTSK